MIVQCSAERLREARRFEPFAHHQEGLRRAQRETHSEATAASVGHLAVETVAGHPEDVVGTLSPVEGSHSVFVTQGPGGTVSAFGMGYSGTSEFLL